MVQSKSFMANLCDENFLGKVHLLDSVDDTTTVEASIPVDKRNQKATIGQKSTVKSGNRHEARDMPSQNQRKSNNNTLRKSSSEKNRLNKSQTKPKHSDIHGSSLTPKSRPTRLTSEQDSNQEHKVASSNSSSSDPISPSSHSPPLLCTSSRHRTAQEGDQRENLLADHVAQMEHELVQKEVNIARLKQQLINLEHDHEEKEVELRSSYNAELTRLQGIITRLQSQTVRTSIETLKRSSSPNTRDKSLVQSTNGEIIGIQLQKEMQEQEQIIAGYQRENERLYTEMKQLQQAFESKGANREAEDTVERLTSENASLHVELECLTRESRIRAKRLEELLSETDVREKEDNIAELEDKLVEMKGDLERTIKSRDAAQTELHHLANNVDRLSRDNRQLSEQYEISISQNQAIRDQLIDEHTETVRELKRKLQWYVENQALVNSDARKIHRQDEDIKKLNAELTITKAQISGSVQSASFDQSLLDLPENVRSMLMQQQLKALQAELESSRENEKRAIRGLQQQYEAVKFQYEERIRTLEEHQCPSTDLTVQNSFRGSAPKHPQSVKQPLLTLDASETECVQQLLMKLRDQICQLKEELSNRQKSIRMLQCVTKLNQSPNPKDLDSGSVRTQSKRIGPAGVKKKFTTRPMVYHVSGKTINNSITALDREGINKEEIPRNNKFRKQPKVNMKFNTETTHECTKTHYGKVLTS